MDEKAATTVMGADERGVLFKSAAFIIEDRHGFVHRAGAHGFAQEDWEERRYIAITNQTQGEIAWTWD